MRERPGTAVARCCPTLMMDGMGSMMGWMMGAGLLGWTLVIGLLITIVVLLVRLLGGGRF
jgi:hypothetical protein